jgi:hypothetical protein
MRETREGARIVRERFRRRRPAGPGHRLCERLRRTGRDDCCIVAVDFARNERRLRPHVAATTCRFFPIGAVAAGSVLGAIPVAMSRLPGEPVSNTRRDTFAGFENANQTVTAFVVTWRRIGPASTSGSEPRRPLRLCQLTMRQPLGSSLTHLGKPVSWHCETESPVLEPAGRVVHDKKGANRCSRSLRAR